MITTLLISTIVLGFLVLFLAFLLLGALRNMAVLGWRLEQLEATTPSRLGRSGLRVGKKAPVFTLASTNGKEVSLTDYANRQVFLVFVQTGCGPCSAVVPELNALHQGGSVQVLAINNASPEAAEKWVREVGAQFPVLIQDRLAVSKKYEVLATPFAFLINEHGTITSKGIVNSKQHIGFVLNPRVDHSKTAHLDGDGAEGGESSESGSVTSSKEVAHV